MRPLVKVVNNTWILLSKLQNSCGVKFIMNLISPLFLFQVLVASRSASAMPSFSASLLPGSSFTISPRQATINETMPVGDDSCQSTCEGLDHLQLDCPMSPDPVKCVCTESAMDSVASCLNCGLSFNNSRSAIDKSQADMDKLVNNCKEAGSPVTSRKLNSSTNGALGLVPGASIIIGALVTMTIL
ncbi:hypothetical protein AB1N83_010762 [Pleurotus pulmonarius]